MVTRRTTLRVPARVLRTTLRVRASTLRTGVRRAPEQDCSNPVSAWSEPEQDCTVPAHEDGEGTTSCAKRGLTTKISSTTGIRNLTMCIPS